MGNVWQWVTYYYNVVKYENGTTPYYLVKKILQDITSKTDVDCIRGHENLSKIFQKYKLT